MSVKEKNGKIHTYTPFNSIGAAVSIYLLEVVAEVAA